MSEYWKSTPKYWCKYCRTYVRDTKPSKSTHDATPKHQGAVKRFLRDLHRGHEREDREKQRAKDEVERLNGVVSGEVLGRRKRGEGEVVAVDLRERKRQVGQLAEMGVAVPEAFRGEMAMVGEWEVLSRRVVRGSGGEIGEGFGGMKEEDGEELEGKALNVGIRRRRRGDGEEDEGEAASGRRRGWGERVRGYPGEEGDEDLDSLLLGAKFGRRGDDGEEVGKEEVLKQMDDGNAVGEKVKHLVDGHAIKEEDGEAGGAPVVTLGDGEASVKQEEGAMDSGVVFKKRKAKQIRQR